MHGCNANIFPPLIIELTTLYPPFTVIIKLSLETFARFGSSQPDDPRAS